MYDGQGVPLENFSMILRGPYKDIFMPLKFVWGGGVYYIRNLAALQKSAHRLPDQKQIKPIPFEKLEKEHINYFQRMECCNNITKIKLWSLMG